MNKSKTNLFKNRFINNTVMLYVMTFAKYVFPLITFPYLTRVLEPDMYGVVTYMTATVSYFGILTDFGFNLSATKKIAENQDNTSLIGEVLGTVLQAKILLGAISLIIFTFMMPFISILRENILLGYLYLISILLNIWLPDFLFRGIEKMEIITTRFIMSKSVVTILIFIFINSKADVILVPVLNIIGGLVAIFFTWKYLKVNLSIKVKFTKFNEVIDSLKVSSIFFASTFATTAFGALNTVMLGIMSLDPVEIAYWGISYQLISTAQSLYSPITTSLYPHIAKNKDFNLAKRILMILMPAIILTVVVVNIFADKIILTFAGLEYQGAIIIFRVLLPVLVFSFPAMVLGFPVLGNLGRVKETTITTILSSIFHILGLLFLAVINKFSLINIAILRSLTEGVLLFSRGLVIVKVKKNNKNRTTTQKI